VAPIKVLRRCYDFWVKTISQRELRNNSAEVIRGLISGETYRLTNRGVPVGILAPASSTPLDELVLREGSQNMAFPPGAESADSTTELLEGLRGIR
jgi:antitoxin (DNA-binding transcriptional repressor) of toxin-antitoxin stability system